MSKESSSKRFLDLNRRIISCKRCPRLRKYCRNVARVKRAAFRNWKYWGKPAPGFGDPQAGLLLIGLAPAAHGTNRTGRMFTGDRSGQFLYAALYRAGFANQPTSVSQEDGLKLRNCYITAAARCAPPGNKPSPRELKNCRGHLEEELKLLKGVRTVLALGRIAHDSYLELLKQQRYIDSRSSYPFKHGATHPLPASLPLLFDSYHPSQQNTQTGRLTSSMMDKVLSEIKRHLTTSPSFSRWGPV
ncbi:MAG: uracil-DNA glycosylase, partial [Elusimicrobia bacterium]|nr:uracil-DNA glycosylase [Elusimicrobiota bacterium]